METATIIEKPMLFTGPMVRAILEGRKTQTRRIVKPQPDKDCAASIKPWYVTAEGELKEIKCPHPVGSRIWVKETWYLNHVDRLNGIPKEHPLDTHGPAEVLFHADGEFQDLLAEIDGKPKWDVSIHMPRWASRITLEVTEVRVQRLQEITFNDALNEGINGPFAPGLHVDIDGDFWPAGQREAVRLFAELWKSINGPESWDANPWVWAYTFKVIKP